MGKKKEKNSRPLIVAVIVLSITVGVLLWLLLRPMPEPDRIPTGNVEVFGIRIGIICRNKDGTSCYDDEDGFIPHVAPPAGKKKSSDGDEKKINGETDTDVEREGIVYVDDVNGRYVYQKNLKIFENAAFEYTSKIAPGVSNSYDFKVHNETEATIRYNVEFTETSEYAVNMQYRLKREGVYVVGNDFEWVDASALSSAFKDLVIDGVDSYSLDWRWPYESERDALDTEIGEKMASEYSLAIKINFEEV